MAYLKDPKVVLLGTDMRHPTRKVNKLPNVPRAKDDISFSSKLYSKKLVIRKRRSACMSSTKQNVEEYLTVSTLHGLRYVGNSELSYAERLFWLISFAVAAILAIYFIIQVYVKYDKSPVISTINPIPVPPHEIPFPAVTICSMNSAMRNQSEQIITNGSVSDRSFLADTCDFSENGQTPVYTEENEKFENFFNFIQRVMPPCDRSVKVCKWRGEEKDCDDLFRQVLTDDGICCTFNQLPISYILRDSSTYNSISGENFTYDIDNWNVEDGYDGDDLQVFPFRSYGPGAHLGLTLVLDAEIEDYYCSSTSSVGFKILLHSPLDIPAMTDFAFMIPPGVESRIIFTPVIYDTVSSVKSIGIDKRKCYFNREKRLKYYRKYSQNNCKMECLANTTMKTCGCVPFYLHTSQTVKTCGKLQDTCVKNVKQTMEMTNTDDGEEWCECLPSCSDLEYQKTMSYGYFTGNFKVRPDIIKDVPLKYFVKNMAVIHIFFITGQFTKYTKSELYGFSEFLSNTGGLLGLFLGFSSLSVVEFVYHFTLRICCIYARKHKSHETLK